MKTEKNRKLHGSVLLTVVFVMSILIVFLFGTMALALASNNRAHANYSSAQTGITARNVAESTIRAIGSSSAAGEAFAQAVGEIDAPGESINVPVTIPDGAGMGHVDDVEIAYAGSRMYQNPDSMLWEPRDVLRFTAKVTLGGVTSTSSIYVMKNFVDTPPPPPSRGMGFSTTAQAQLNCQVSIWGGGYIGIPSLSEAQAIRYDDNHASLASSFPADKTTSLTNAGSGYSADLYVYNNLHIENCKLIYFPEKGTGLTVWGDMDVNSANNRDHLNYVYSGDTDEFDFTEIPYVYVDGKFTGALIGPRDSSFPVNLFCGSINADTGNDVWMSANIYCMDSDKDNYIGSNNPKDALKAWTGSVIYQTIDTSPSTTVCGDVCVNGNLEIENVTVKGDLRVRGNCKFGQNVIVNGNVVIEGNVTGDVSVAEDHKLYTKNGGEVDADNKVCYYYRFIPDTSDGFYRGVNDELLNIPGYIVNGELVEGVDPLDLTYVYYFVDDQYEINDDIVDSEDRKSKIAEWLSPVADAEVKVIAGTDDRYYAETVYLGVNSEGDYEYEAHIGVPVDSATFTHPLVSEDFAEAMDIYRTTYPDYAERINIVGDESKYKIVNRVEEVFSKVSDPYEYDMDLDDISSFLKDGTVKPKLADVYNLITASETDGSIKNLVPEFPRFTSEDSIISGVGRYVSNLYGDIAGGGMQKYNISVSSSVADKVNGTVYIDQNCVLDMSLEGGKTIVLDPGATGIVIVVDRLSLAKDATIVVRDDVPGKVHMIVRSGGYINHYGNSGDGCVITTTSYWNTFADHYGEDYKVVSRTGAPAVTASVDMSNMKPNLYIYAETTKGSDSNPTLNFSDFTGYATANIVSPNLDLSIASTNGNRILDNAVGSFYYDGMEIGDYGVNDFQFAIFGAVNSKNTNIPNVLSVIYIPDGSNTGNNMAQDAVYSYYGLYYDEY
ncbi:MAG: polymer-forming cytoskeletal protein [Ruminococcus sp.]|nr:polymer-forming cytoskeletal protein [Ruminococcus sp.]MDE6784387.1 polymer-forming cytoskeletal protein [Ruminococcus sp.]